MNAEISPRPSGPRVGPGVAVGVTEAMIHDLVHAFYGKARHDPLLGSVFEGAVADWDAHLAKLCDFWSSVTLMTGRFHGTPMAAHAALADLGSRHFVRWLELFRETVEEVCPPPAAELFKMLADRIGRSLQMGIAVMRGERLLQKACPYASESTSPANALD